MSICFLGTEDMKPGPLKEFAHIRRRQDLKGTIKTQWAE